MATDPFDVVEDETGEKAIVLRIVTEPGPGRASVAAHQGDALRIRLAMPPGSDRANATCIELIADVFSTTQDNVAIIEGIKQRRKSLKVSNVDIDQAEAMIDRAIGTPLSSRNARRTST